MQWWPLPDPQSLSMARRGFEASCEKQLNLAYDLNFLHKQIIHQVNSWLDPLHSARSRQVTMAMPCRRGVIKVKTVIATVVAAKGQVK